MHRSMLIALLMLVPVAAWSQRDFSDVEIKPTHLAGSVWRLEGAGGNIGVSVGADGILIVDDQFAPLADKIQAALGELGEGKLRFVLNTHYHGDHVGGNAAFGREAPIIAHHNVRRRLSGELKSEGHEQEPAAHEALPVITFDDSLSVHFNGEEIRMVHFPHGHTDGDSVIFFPESNVVHMGDLLFAGLFPFVDLGAGGDLRGYIRNVETVMGRLKPGVKIIGGHGPLVDLDDLRAWHRMLVETTAYLQAKIEAGKSLETLRAEGLPDKYKSYSWSFVPTKRWIDTVYASLTGKPVEKERQ